MKCFSIVCSIYGVANAFTFKTICDDDLIKIQTFVQHDLIDILQGNLDSRNENLTVDLPQYFGDYSLHPKNFEFSINEKQQIFKCIKHVQYTVDLDGVNENLTHFSLNNDEHKSTEVNSSKCVPVSDEIPDTKTHIFLKKLLRIADQNATRKKGGYRFDEDIKQFATYFRMLAGPLAYETLQKNLELCLPSLSSTNRYMRKQSNNIVEGCIRTNELVNYLKARDLPPFVALSEDATRITGTVQYDAKTNLLVGFVLPINQENGIPIQFAYQARSADEILKHFVSEHPVAHYVNVVMVQPLARVAPFCLLLYGSDNKNSAENVADRWEFIVEELRKVGITVVSVSSDSDPKFNSAMKRISKIGTKSNIFPKRDWFSCGSIIRLPFCVQDHIHIATKLRNLLLKTLCSPEMLPFGNYYIKIEHLHYLIKNTKDKHMLTASTLDPEDRQNYSSVERMCNERVINLLKTQVKNSMGTATYLELLRYIVDSYVDIGLSPLQRVRKIWYALFVIRIWRDYIKSHPNFSITDNFMSTYSYSCIEMNAHSLVLIMLYLKDKNMPNLFTPQLYNSQVCEETFRQIRSFTTVYSTVANCSIKEIIGRLDKIQLQNDISLNSNFLFPRSKSRPTTTDLEVILPTKEEICCEIEKCKLDAIKFSEQMGLVQSKNVNKSNKLTCDVSVYRGSNWVDVRDEEIKKPLPKFGNIDLRDYSKQIAGKTIDETSSYVKLSCLKKTMYVKKTSLCWFLRRDTYKLSSDRIVRVKSRFTEIKKNTSRRRKKINKRDRKN